MIRPLGEYTLMRSMYSVRKLTAAISKNDRHAKIVATEKPIDAPVYTMCFQ